MEDQGKYSHIPGWGIDADPKNEPTYPMKKYTGDDHHRLNYQRPSQQPVKIEVLHSNERPSVSAAFGTSVPPKGLSGAIRRFAFKYSEGRFAHWLPLLFADRVNVVEGLVNDISTGHLPNIFAERGWRSEWKYNSRKAMKKLVVRTAVVTAILVILAGRRKRKYA